MSTRADRYLAQRYEEKQRRATHHFWRACVEEDEDRAVKILRSMFIAAAVKAATDMVVEEVSGAAGTSTSTICSNKTSP